MQHSDNALENRDRDESVPVTRELVEQFLASNRDEIELTAEEKERFIATALSYSLNPFKRELHARVSLENGMRRCHLIVGYEVYIKTAERTGILDGWRAWVEGSGDDRKAVVEIYRKDWSKPFLHEVYWTEAMQTDGSGNLENFWTKMPRFQLKKVAISQGFRLCFADEIGGIPYDSSELPASKPLPPKPKTGTAPSGKPHSLVDEILKLLKERKGLFSTQHIEWIEVQLAQNKTASQLQGLLKHVQETIDKGGDEKPVRSERGRKGEGRQFPAPRRPETQSAEARTGIKDDIF